MIELTDAARVTAGVVALTVVAIESGGAFLLRVATGKEQATDFQKSFYRAGHAHAGVLVTLGLVCLLLGEATVADRVLALARADRGARRGDRHAGRLLLLRHGTGPGAARTGPSRCSAWAPCCSPPGSSTLGVGPAARVNGGPTRAQARPSRRPPRLV